MTKTQDTLRIIHNFLYIQAYGGNASPSEFKLMADLCALALPMKYRWSREQLDLLKQQATLQRSGKALQ